MALRRASSNNPAMEDSGSFMARGGAWVLAQALVLSLAAAIPVITGMNSLRPLHSVQWVGALLTAIGLFFAVAAWAALGNAMTPFPAPRNHAALCMRGAYAWVRHPMYTGMIVGAFGWALFWRSSLGLAFTVLVFVFLDRKAALEEAWLREKFRDYADYQERVKKLIPLIY